MMLVTIRHTERWGRLGGDVSTLDYRYVVNANEIHVAADLAMREHKTGHKWDGGRKASDGSIHDIRPIGNVFWVI